MTSGSHYRNAAVRPLPSAEPGPDRERPGRGKRRTLAVELPYFPGSATNGLPNAERSGSPPVSGDRRLWTVERGNLGPCAVSVGETELERLTAGAHLRPTLPPSVVVGDPLVRSWAPGRGDGLDRRVSGQADATGSTADRTGDRPRSPADVRMLDSHACSYDDVLFIPTQPFIGDGVGMAGRGAERVVAAGRTRRYR